MTGSRPVEERFCRGELIVRQHSDGYRFSVDAVLAAGYCSLTGEEEVLDLGCGCGIIALLLAHAHPHLLVTGLELQPGLVHLARDNAKANGLQNRVRMLQGDARRPGDFLQAESFDLVVFNPPYRSPGSGRRNRSTEAARARHELDGGLKAMARCAAFAVRNRRPVITVFPAPRLAYLATVLAEHRLILKRLRPVYPHPEADRACLVLTEAVKNGGPGCCLEPPLYIHARKNGPYTPEMQTFYTPDAKEKRACWPGC